jgi:hypothetical protein
MEVNKWLPTNITCLSGLKEERKMGDEEIVFKRIALCGLFHGRKAKGA